MTDARGVFTRTSEENDVQRWLKVPGVLTLAGVAATAGVALLEPPAPAQPAPAAVREVAATGDARFTRPLLVPLPDPPAAGSGLLGPGTLSPPTTPLPAALPPRAEFHPA
ncbi:hypothetical protein [Kineococcus sp. SYSU DK006]|uniref:hypothetical protein n=1 Tax=Kineococcus sp. SYSU DK006 TaxID=3383127 RepID=UPI003D7DB7B8